MNFKPILFSTPMIKAIMNGTKTQTRRIIKPQPLLSENAGFCVDGNCYGLGFSRKGTDRNFISCKSKIQESDTLWVRETWALYGWDSIDGRVTIIYKDGKTEDFYPDVIDIWLEKQIDQLCEKGYLEMDPDDEDRLRFSDSERLLWKPSIFMPKWACRLFLKVKNVGIEELQEISENDAKYEGAFDNNCGVNNVTQFKSGFQDIWENINGKESWDANPWVWVYEFEQIKRPSNF